ncbi:MAG TPA: YitT family protein [Fervidobacterium sp.]|nr:YitT family protein [Fervidobacterium sp.]HPT54935.1 YitT family protein [Fervidobacterium sp.]HPZ18516.1 YitT family protein [Fervidobacterium sp.]HQE49845.1 YitT family protein [Fervidobacterium sp.]HRD20900.1 YitT family protein [Fervidobacterium sp.]
MREQIKEYVLSTVGVILTALGLVVFFIPNNIAAGGASGISIILHRLIPLIPIGVWLYMINAFLFILGFLIVGRDFSFKTIYSTFALSFFVDLFDRILEVPKYSGEDLMLAVFFGDVLAAIGMAITFANNSSTGGTDIIARILTKYFHTPIGTTLLIVDFMIGIAAGFTFDFRIGMYALLAIIINGVTIDFVLKGLELSITMTIISQKSDDIKAYILANLERGVTILKAKGAYSGKELDVLYVALKRRELSEILHLVKNIDSEAFVIVTEARYVLGEGFKRIDKVA